MGHSPVEDRGFVAPVAALFGTLYKRARLGGTLAAHDRPEPGQAAKGRCRDRAERDHDPGLWRRLSAGPGRLARPYRWSGQADIRWRAALGRSWRRHYRGPRRSDPGSAPDNGP